MVLQFSETSVGFLLVVFIEYDTRIPSPRPQDIQLPIYMLSNPFTTLAAANTEEKSCFRLRFRFVSVLRAHYIGSKAKAKATSLPDAFIENPI